MKIRRTLQRLRALNEFDKLVSPELIAKLEASSELKWKEIQRRHFQFILVHVEEDTPDGIPLTISKTVSTFLNHHAMLSGIESSLVVGCLGIPFPENDSVEGRRSLVAALLAENGDRVRIAHGQCHGMVGNLGTQGNWRYSGIIPDFSVILKRLLDTHFGTAVEIC